MIVQYARDQAVVSARDQAQASVSPRRMDHGEHIICLESSKNGRITILRLPDNYNRHTGTNKCGRGSYACMRRRADKYSITTIFSYKFKIVNNKEKP